MANPSLWGSMQLLLLLVLSLLQMSTFVVFIATDAKSMPTIRAGIQLCTMMEYRAGPPGLEASQSLESHKIYNHNLFLLSTLLNDNYSDSKLQSVDLRPRTSGRNWGGHRSMQPASHKAIRRRRGAQAPLKTALLWGSPTERSRRVSSTSTPKILGAGSLCLVRLGCHLRSASAVHCVPPR